MDYINEEQWQVLRQSVNHVVDVVNSLPGAAIVVKYVQNSYQNDPWRLFLETVLIVILINYLFSRRYKIKNNPIKLSEKEVDELVREWQPEPFAPALSKESQRVIESLPIVEGPVGISTVVNGEAKVNFASFNFLGFAGSEQHKVVAKKALDKYGVGSCGPPGFYGTIDVHTQLEKKCASFLGTEDAILYSFGFATIASAIPAFCKRGDLIIADTGVAFPIQKGILISRANVKYFKHNDVADLERILEEVKKEDAKSKKPVSRRFIIVEGLYQNYGDIAPLKQLVELKKKYKYRLIVEESLSLGVLGKTGRGITEHAGVPVSDVEMIVGGLCNALSGGGGICAGSLPYVDHQRLSGQGYCFSASMPALLAASDIASLEELESHPEYITKLRQNASLLWDELKSVKQLNAVGESSLSPVVHLQLASPAASFAAEEHLLQDIVDEALKQGILLTRAKYVVREEVHLPRPSIRVTVSQAHTPDQIRKAVAVIKAAAASISLKA